MQEKIQFYFQSNFIFPFLIVSFKDKTGEEMEV